MAILIHKNKTLLKEMKMATGLWEISRGLMWSTNKRVAKGICLVMPTDKDVQFGSSVTMLFCFQKLEILFINTNFEVVDKKILKPWLPNYTPKAACKYVVESKVGTFTDVKIGDSVEIKSNYFSNQNKQNNNKSKQNKIKTSKIKSKQTTTKNTNIKIRTNKTKTTKSKTKNNS